MKELQIHPEKIQSYIPKRKFKISTKAETNISEPTESTEPTEEIKQTESPKSIEYKEDCYDDLTDKTPYSGYAWAFLRRNRFYQRYIDDFLEKQEGSDTWALKLSDEYYSMGIISTQRPKLGDPQWPKIIKPYWEAYNNGTKVEWDGIHSFFSQHHERVLERKHPQHWRNIDLNQDPDQIWFCFDLRPFLGGKLTPIEIQLDLARKMLAARIEERKLLHKTPRQMPSKRSLRKLLRIADLCSPEREISEQAPTKQAIEKAEENKQSATEESATQKPPNLVWEIDPEEKRTKELAAKLIDSDFKKDTPQKLREHQMYALVSEASKYVYEWDCLQLLAFDNWAEVFFPASDASPG